MSLNTIIQEIIEQERRPIYEASDINKDWHNDIVKQWRLSASPDEVIDAFVNPVDDAAERLQFAIALDSPYGPSVELSALIASYWWRQISGKVDKAIEAAREGMEEPEPQDDPVASDRREIAKEWNAKEIAS